MDLEMQLNEFKLLRGVLHRIEYVLFLIIYYYFIYEIQRKINSNVIA